MTLPLCPVGCMPLFGCPLLETNQHAPTTAKGIIQRPPRLVQRMRERGGMTWDVSFQLNCEKPRAAHWRQVSRSFLKFNSKQPNARHHPPRTQLNKHPSLADEGRAIRGRVHADVRRRAQWNHISPPIDDTTDRTNQLIHGLFFLFGNLTFSKCSDIFERLQQLSPAIGQRRR